MGCVLVGRAGAIVAEGIKTVGVGSTSVGAAVSITTCVTSGVVWAVKLQPMTVMQTIRINKAYR
jgi:hypothetical protein